MSAYERAEEHVVMSKEGKEPSGLHESKHQENFLAKGLTGTSNTVLNNPVLPSDFDLLDRACAVRPEWEFAGRDPVTGCQFSQPSRQL